jgi:hypothetical protein
MKTAQLQSPLTRAGSPCHGCASILLSFILVFFAPTVHAHDPLLDLPEPTSVPEAWNVITQSITNVEKCLDTNQLKELSYHVANCSPAIRVLQAHAKSRGEGDLVKQLESLFYSGDAIITATRQPPDPIAKGREAHAVHRAAVDAVARHYNPDVVTAAVYNCVHHPLDRSLDPKAKCPKCSMSLIKRRIPASTTYERPGEPSMKLDARADAPLQPGKRVTVTLTLKKNDGTPVTPRDLLLMHTEKIHLLIIDQSLSDYHHEHPQPLDTPGVYVFSLTPKMPGPYRIFADVVPAESSVQEYVVADLPSDIEGEPVTDRQTRLTGEAGRLRFALTFDAKATDIRANRPIAGTLMVSTAQGKPFDQLQPVMGAFAHLVAFNEDRKTVLHIHPEGPEPKDPEARGGPALKFKLYAPRPGFYRLYAQLQIKGAPVFVPFNLRILPDR